MKKFDIGKKFEGKTGTEKVFKRLSITRERYHNTHLVSKKTEHNNTFT